MKKRIGILTGGGDVQSLNAVISGARNKAINKNIELVGIIKGWEGAIEADYVNLSNVSIKPQIGGTIIKSSRANINKVKNGPQVILDNFHKNNITGLIVIGGEDTLSNAFHIQSFPQILISKTIDNDVGKIEDKGEELKFENIINYFTLGFPTAAEKISSFVSLKEGLRTTAYSHERIIVVESMGMHAGWLALSSGMGSPDFVIIPEFPLDYDLFLDKVFKRYKSQRHMIIVIAEGAKWRTGSYIYTEKDENEDFDHPRFGGPAQALKTRLKKDLAKYFNIRNINSVNPSYLYRAGAPNDLDQHWAKRLGEMAVKYLSEGMNESIFLSIQRYDSGFKVKDIPLSRFNSIEQLHRFVDKRFYDPQEFQMTEQGRKYLRNIVKEFPLEKEYGLSNIKVN
jgi:6-phosphofructokinase 1